jgi:hypothetical protein
VLSIQKIRLKLKPLSVLCLLVFPAISYAFGFTTLFWSLMICLVLAACLLFAIASAITFQLVSHQPLRRFILCIFFGLFFGLFFGPVYVPSGIVVPNIASLFPGVGGEGVLVALLMALLAAVIVAQLVETYRKYR